MAALTTIALATAPFLAGPVGTIQANRDQRKARREQRTASLIEQEKAAVQNARNRRRAAATAQAQNAQIQAQEATLQGSSSGSATSQGAVTSQTAGNISFQRQLEGMSGLQTNALNRASQYQADAQRAQALGSIPGQLGFTPGAFLGQFKLPSFGGSSTSSQAGGSQMPIY
jgi:uncharacterized membrane protein YdfJ with MMPL/SSD domain